MIILSVIKNRKTDQASNLILLENEPFAGVCPKCNKTCHGLRCTQNIITKNVRYVCEYHAGIDEKEWCPACLEWNKAP